MVQYTFDCDSVLLHWCNLSSLEPTAHDRKHSENDSPLPKRPAGWVFPLELCWWNNPNITHYKNGWACCCWAPSSCEKLFILNEVLMLGSFVVRNLTPSSAEFVYCTCTQSSFTVSKQPFPDFSFMLFIWPQNSLFVPNVCDCVFSPAVKTLLWD